MSKFSHIANKINSFYGLAKKAAGPHSEPSRDFTSPAIKAIIDEVEKVRTMMPKWLDVYGVRNTKYGYAEWQLKLKPVVMSFLTDVDNLANVRGLLAQQQLLAKIRDAASTLSLPNSPLFSEVSDAGKRAWAGEVVPLLTPVLQSVQGALSKKASIEKSAEGLEDPLDKLESLMPWRGTDIKDHERMFYNHLEHNEKKMIRSLPKHQRLSFLRTLMDAEAHDESNAKDHKEHKRCNCEQSECERRGKHKPGDCKNSAGDKKAMYIGSICDECAKTMPEKYMLTDKK